MIDKARESWTSRNETILSPLRGLKVKKATIRGLRPRLKPQAPSGQQPQTELSDSLNWLTG